MTEGPDFGRALILRHLAMLEAGYDPTSLIGVMKILKEASGGQSRPEFASTHPDPENRIAKIEEAIKKYASVVQ